MSMISAPYRFVPLSKLVLLPDWADQVSHDQPFADGLCGDLTLRLTTHTPLCVGGRQDKSSEREPGKVYFFRTPDDQVAIPGTSVKGMLRNVLEIASFGRFKQVEDQRLGVRDLQQKFYKDAIAKPRAGWLTLTDGQWQIQPCRYSRLAEADLIEHCKVAKHIWKDRKTAPLRYGVIGICPQVTFDDEGKGKPNPQGRLKGRIVVTGQPSAAKTDEFIFHDSDDPLLPVSSVVMAGFSQIHEGRSEWSFWKEALTEGHLKTGIPVFFHMDGGAVRSLGLAKMYKLPYTHSLHDAIRHTHEEHLAERAPDLPDLLFGTLGNDSQGGLRGRVNIGLASLATEGPVTTAWQKPCVLNGPKPTFYPAYVRQDGKGSFRQLMEKHAELAGWKRYPVKNMEISEPGDKSGPSVQVRLETVPSGTVFECTLRFHNLRRVELGALVWALDFGNPSKYRHALGMGKPFGLGQVELSVAGMRLRSNTPDPLLDSQGENYLFACRREFIDLMDQTVRAAGQTSGWEDSAPIKALQEYATPADNAHALSYLRLEEFTALRKNERLDEVRETFHSVEGIVPSKGYDTTQTRGYDSRFAENLREAEVQLLKQAQKLELKRQQADATPEEALLLEIADLSASCLDGTATSTEKNNLPKALNRAHETSMDFDEDQKAELRRLADLCNQLESKKIQQACKKILRDV
jgi:CRISPR-associated protein (TIGR03986 family)